MVNNVSLNLGNTAKSQATKASEGTPQNSIFGNLNETQNTDSVFSIEKTTPTKEVKAPAKTDSTKGLENAPKPTVMVNGQEKTAKYVISLSENKLYKYDKDGNAEAMHSIASGAKSTPTHKGLRVITGIETYPYKNAPAGSKRR